MSRKVFVYDPTSSDKLSSVRGIGRYLQILKESFGKSWIFTDSLKRIFADSVFISPFYNFLQPPLTFKRIAKKQIAVIHDLIPLKYPSHFPAGLKGSIYILLNRFALKNYDLIITDSEASKVDIINILHIEENKIKVIYPCLPKVFQQLSFPRRRESKSRDVINHVSTKNVIIDWIPSYEGMTTSKFCLYVGDATWNKNLVNLARAIKIANVTCVFVGKIFSNVGVDPRVDPNQNDSGGHSGPPLHNIGHPWQREFKQFISETKDDKRFIFAGFVPDSGLIKLYQQSSLNILPSRDEGFGFSYLEAAQFSCPSVLSDISVLKEISNGSALFADPKNPQDLADKIGEIYFNKNLRDDLGKKAFQRSKFFSPKKFKKELLTVIK